MDPVVKSLLTSVAGVAATALATFAVNHAWITAEQGQQLSAYLSSILLGAAASAAVAVIAWVHSRQNTQAAMIDAVNKAPNGVTVVPTTAAIAADIPPVNAPLKGT